tara:strand:+ start:1094 stop:1441 length:348 start_codon:yes stop_codon:yes gene_type:complete
MNMKNKYENGKRCWMYVLQPIPRKDRKMGHRGPLVIYGWKKTMGTVLQNSPYKGFCWMKPDDRAYTMTTKYKWLGDDHPADEDGYIYLEDLREGHPLWMLPGLKDPDELLVKERE